MRREPQQERPSANSLAKVFSEYTDLDLVRSDAGTVRVGVIAGQNGTIAALAPLRAAELGPIVELGEADTVTLLGVVDLNGEPVSIDLTEPPGKAGLPLRVADSASQPALLMLTRERPPTGEERDSLVLCAVGAERALLWREVIRSIRSDGGGYQSFEVAMVSSDGDERPLEIELYQTTVPPHGAAPSMPGPPLLLRFRISREMYSRYE
jgi:hypothetical protein